jgi:metal-responsive CopG/Arc/MetJ family transcriptional regulator
MSTTKVAITIDEKTLIRLDKMVAERKFPSRSRAIQDAVKEKLNRMERHRLARECGKLDVEFERGMAEEGMAEIAEWPEY